MGKNALVPKDLTQHTPSRPDCDYGRDILRTMRRHGKVGETFIFLA